MHTAILVVIRRWNWKLQLFNLLFQILKIDPRFFLRHPVMYFCDDGIWDQTGINVTIQSNLHV